MIKKSLCILLLFSLTLIGAYSNNGRKKNPGRNETSKLIKTEVPVRPAKQNHAVGLVTPRINTVRVGFIGLGMRGPSAVQRFMHIPGVDIIALCDLHEDRVEKVQQMLKTNEYHDVAAYSGSETAWKELCDRDDIDLIYITTDWKLHAEMSIYAMEKGKHVAVEVPGAMTLKEIWAVINTAERTRKHCMMLENCVYDDFELTTLNMLQKGVFGEVLYAEGAYIHQLEEVWPEYESDWRMKYNREHRGDIYPTHGMGPACQALDIHRGDKMNFLVAIDSKPVSIPAYLTKKHGEEVKDFKNGQHTMTLIRTEKGKTIQIQHDVASPRPYSRMYNISGTNGFATKYPNPEYALNFENFTAHNFIPSDVRNSLMSKYQSPILTDEMKKTANELGAVAHGGMDFIMDYRLIYCLRNGLPLDMDVYDLAEWSCLVPLTELSLENGSAPVEIPDFTRGHWKDSKGYRHYLLNEPIP